MSNYDNEEPKTMYDENKDKLKGKYDSSYIELQDYKINAVNETIRGIKKYPLDDTGNANRLVERYGSEFRYNVDDKCWMIYDDIAWRRDNKKYIKKLADRLIDYMYFELRKMDRGDGDSASYVNDFYRNIKRLSSSNGKDAMLKEAEHLGNIAITNNELDTQNDLLNCKNGVVDLKTGKMMPHDKELMMSKCTNIDVDMDNEPTRWIKFVTEVFGGDEKMVDYLQTIMGYTLTGSIKEQCMFQCCGDGANGKSVLLNVIYNIMGDYSLNAQIDSILDKGKNNGNANPDIARMHGARFIRTNEPKEGVQMNEGLVKQLVGGDVITARKLYANEFEFTPVGKLWIATNHKLVICGTDNGIWRRQQLIMFKETFEGARADKELPDKLKEEYSQILGWAIKGAIRWYKEGISIPPRVEDSSKEYRTEMDVVASFLKENVTITPNGKEKAGDVFKAYYQWAKLGNEQKISQTKFGREMAKRFKKKTIAGYAYYVGFVLKSNDHAYIFSKDNL